MTENATERSPAVQQLLARIKGGETVKADEGVPAAAEASRDGLVERDPKGHLTLTARGRHLVDG